MNSSARSAVVILSATGLLSMGCMSARLPSASAKPRVTPSGPTRSHSRTVASFRRIELGVPGKVELEVGPSPAVEVLAPDNVNAVIDVSVADETLSIDTDARIDGDSQTTLKIKVPSLEGITVLGSNEIVSNRFSAKNLSLALNGAGSVILEGTADNLSITINGAGDLNLKKFKVKSASIQINGAGDITVDATETLDADIRGGGTIRYLGSPRVTKSVAGAGTVERA